MADHTGRIATNLEALIGAESIDPVEQIKRKSAELEKALTLLGKNSAEKVAKYEAELKKKQDAEDLKSAKKLAKEAAELTQSNFTKVVKNVGNQFAKALGAGLKSAMSSIDSYIRAYTQHMGTITTRLQGTALNYNTLLSDVQKNLGTSPYFTQTDMIDNLNKFVQSGISYNLETRAFIATATNKIATTFDAFDSSLLRLIRIQQADTTVARIGMESLLNKFLNARFEDTSYLNTSSNISSLLTEAESLMGYKGAAEFEYVVQRGLGTMSSLGVSSNTINAIASGLGYLGSGQASALTGNQSLMRLITLGASRAGLDIGQILNQGLTPQTAANLLGGIVNLGQSVAGMSGNVARAEFASQLGLSVSDLVSLTNITTSDLKAITSNILKYEDLRNETATQLATISQRTTTSEKVQNVLENVKTGLGINIANDPFLYAMWEAANLVSASGLDYTIKASPFGIGIDTNLSSIMKTAAIGGGAINSITNAIAAISAGNLAGTNISSWGERETRGSGLGAYTSGISTSTSSYIGNVSTEEFNQETFAGMKKTGSEYTGSEDQTNINDIIKDSIDVNVKGIYGILSDWDTRLSNSQLGRIFGY